MGRPLIDITGQRFGRLVAIEHPYRSPTWRCRCDCGNETWVIGSSLVKGKIRSCGCLNSELAAARKFKHGRTGTPEYISWQHAKKRCTDPTDKRWAAYGGRGISMCREWMDDFAAFFSHVGPRPSARHTLDRIDVDGNYEPGNVRWATHTQQMNNMRTNHRVTWNGETRTIAEWAAIVKLPAGAIALRLRRYGYTVERALTQPVATAGWPYRRTHRKTA